MKEELIAKLKKALDELDEIDYDYLNILDIQSLDNAITNVRKETSYCIVKTRFRIKEE